MLTNQCNNWPISPQNDQRIDQQKSRFIESLINFPPYASISTSLQSVTASSVTAWSATAWSMTA